VALAHKYRAVATGRGHDHFRSLWELPTNMAKVTRRANRRVSTPPRESILSTVVGEFLDPIDALFTVFFSILFALLFTLAYSILLYLGVIDASFSAGYGQELFFTVLWAVAAWGIIDGMLYVMAEVFARRERIRLLRYVQASNSVDEAATIVGYELDFVFAPITNQAQRTAIYHDIVAHLTSAEIQPTSVQRQDIIGGVATIVLSVVAVLPSLLPLLLLPNHTAPAIRISNVISFAVIFAVGYFWGIHTHSNPWKVGLLLAAVCLSMVLVALLLGG
jgi:hypothetical protein